VKPVGNKNVSFPLGNMKAPFEQLNLGTALPDMQVLQGQSTQGNPLTDSLIAMEEVELAISQLKPHKELG